MPAEVRERRTASSDACGTCCCARSSAVRTSPGPAGCCGDPRTTTARASARSCMSCGWKNSCGSAVWMNAGTSSLANSVPQRIELGIVDLQSRAIGLGDPQAELLADLADADRAGLDVGVAAVASPCSPQPGPTLRKSMPASTRKRSLCGEALIAAIVWSAARRDSSRRRVITRRLSGPSSTTMPLHRLAGGERSRVAVHVDRRELCLRHLVLGGHQRDRRPVVEDAGRRSLRAPGSCPALTSVVPGGHSCPGASRVPPPRWAASAAVSAAGASKRTINLDLFINEGSPEVTMFSRKLRA